SRRGRTWCRPRAVAPAGGRQSGDAPGAGALLRKARFRGHLRRDHGRRQGVVPAADPLDAGRFRFSPAGRQRLGAVQLDSRTGETAAAVSAHVRQRDGGRPLSANGHPGKAVHAAGTGAARQRPPARAAGRMTARRQLAAALVTLAAAAAGFGQTAVAPAKRLPPAGIALAAADRAELTAGAAALRQDIDQLGRELARTPTLAALLPDLEIFHKAVDWALRYDEFFAPKEIALARHFLAEGRERVAQVRSGRASWLDAKGLVVRGYRSKLDGSVQPYGLFVPAGWQRERPNRLEVWLLGRGEKRTELAFLAEREAGPPQLVPRDTIVLVPYGRFCNATKFAGEVDVFEAM